MKVLMLATYFPRPGNPLLGTWALDQARALGRAGAAVEVVSLNPWFPPLPGAGRGYRAYAACPPHHDWDGLRVHYPRWPCYPLRPFGAWYHRHPGFWLRLAWPVARRRVLALARAFGPDIVFAHHTSVNGWVAAQVAAALGVPFVSQDHDYGEVESCAVFPARRRLVGAVAGQAAAVLAVSRRMKDDLDRLFPGVRTVVFPNGANPPAGGADVATPRPPVVFGAGMLIERKGFDVLLRAWAAVHREFPAARLRIAGDGPERGRLEALREELGLRESVDLLGYQPQAAVQREMAAARAFALVSWNEPFAVVFMEAIAAGTPVIWSRDGGVSDVFTDGVHGLAVEPHDAGSAARALRRMLGDEAAAAAMGRAALALHHDRLSWDAVGHRALELFRDAIARRRPADRP